MWGHMECEAEDGREVFLSESLCEGVCLTQTQTFVSPKSSRHLPFLSG